MFNNLLILGIETSCDDTGISVFNNKNGILSEYVFTQKIHQKYGGTVPELSSRDHLKKIFNIINFVLKKKLIKFKNLHAIAYTKGPGLKGSLFIGASVAKSLSNFLKIPAIGINHLEAHFLINLAFNKKITYPCLNLLISGAHTLMILMKKYNQLNIIGETLDDGVGEAFDKIARLFNLKPFSGTTIEKKIKYKFIYNNLNLCKKMKNTKDYIFSFSGLKTEILRLYKKNNKYNLLYNFQITIILIFINKCRFFLKNNKIKYIILSGGVSANKELRLAISNLAEEFDINVNILPKQYCTDNGVMVAILGFIKIYDNYIDTDLNINTYPNLILK